MISSGTYDSFALERVTYGRPAVAVADEEVERLGCQRVFLLVSRTLRRKTSCVRDLEERLGNRCVAVGDGIPPHTPRDAVLDIAAAARDARADLVLTFGGGSITDAGKLLRLALQHDFRDTKDFDPFVVRVNPDGTRVVPSYEGPTIPQIAIPTTLSGGEFNVSAGCTDPSTALKEIYRHKHLVPRVVILDPAVTTPTPDWLWLSTGIRALDHAVETVCATDANPRSYLDSIEAIRLLADALPRTHKDPADLDARLAAQNAVWLAMEHNRFGIPMGASHGIGHVLGGTCDVPHGHTSCVLLPVVLQYNVGVNGDRQALIAQAMGRPNIPAWQAVSEFIAALGMPRSLADVGVRENQFPAIAAAALLDHYVHTNPRPLHDLSDILEILRLAA
jgi:maleylacetate reductase